MKKGQPARGDYEYERNGTANLFAPSPQVTFALVASFRERQDSTVESRFLAIFRGKFGLPVLCVVRHISGMIRANTELPVDLLRWMEKEAAGLWPAFLGSLSVRPGTS